nr:hypothetical protein CFP56_28883 [Quercus suber]
MIDWMARRRASILEKHRIDDLKRKKEKSDSENKYKDKEADSEKKFKDGEANSETKKYKVLEEEETSMKAEMRAMKNLDLSNLPPRGKIEEAESPPSQSWSWI